jgi:predicted DNA-binding transcriptional regulator YafY
MPPLLLDDEEAVAVALGLRTAATGAVDGIEEASVRALSKVEQILPPRLGRRVGALQAMIVTPAGAKSPVDARTLTALADACRDRQSLRFRYCDHAGTPTTRSVEPHRLVHTGRRWYLVAWDSTRKDWRTFRVDRIQPRVSLGLRFAPRDPPARDLAAYVSRGVWNAPPCRARVRLLAAAEVIAGRLPPCVGLIEPVDEQSCFFEVGGSTFQSLAMHLALLGVDFELSEPQELVDEVRRLADRFRKAAGASTAQSGT